MLDGGEYEWTACASNARAPLGKTSWQGELENVSLGHGLLLNTLTIRRLTTSSRYPLSTIALPEAVGDTALRIVSPEP